ncbi:LysR family transcriptional regulator [Phenylobacterium sp. Root700]|uniref:LysR family transcriptional regulator n=1 Tax=Phenylobacterium sp. Root700 TaxID=1736591 RepID=UPI0006F5C8A4|nr:LysR family transcriptional regulator [Phenylobacterium sp. Root700]KRB39834.1 LysR family transcriptional regulator [Phenylobacterium sp. Root700]
MARSEVNRSTEMEVFVRVVETGGLSSAARALRITPSAVSKLIGRLEARLGARLLNRSTRKLQLTPEGAAFYARSAQVLADIDEAEREVTAGAAPRGRVRVNSVVDLGRNLLLPLVPSFLAAHPDVTLDLVLTDQVVDLLDERADVAIRVGSLRSSSLTARKLGQSRAVVVASPGYLARRGTPTRLEDLAQHHQMDFTFTRSVRNWPFKLESGEVVYLPGVGGVQLGDGESVRRLALEGAGLARLSVFSAADDIKTGRLVPVLEAFNPGDVLEVHVVFLGQGGHLPARVRAFIDYLAENMRLPTWSPDA